AMAFGLGYQGLTLHLIVAVAIGKAFEGVSDVVFGLLQKAENLRRVAVSMLAKGVISLLAVGLVLQMTGDIILATVAMALCWGSLLLTYDLPAAVRLESIRPTLELGSLGRLVSAAFPLGCVAGISSLTVNVPRYAVEANGGEPALGVFTALAYLFVAALQPMLALGAAVNPRLARHFVHDLAAFRRLTSRTMVVAGALGLLGLAACALFGSRLLTLFYSPVRPGATDPKAPPLIAEITGCSGSGKSTLLAEILRECAARGLRVATAEDVLLPRLGRLILRHPTLQNVALDLRGASEVIRGRRPLE